MQIEVTQEYIDKGQTKDAYSCPIALAIKEKINILSTVAVHKREIFINDALAIEIQHLPMEAYKFVKDYDAKKPVKPFSFDVEIGDNFLK